MITRVEDLVELAKARKDKPRIVAAAANDINVIEGVYHAWEQRIVESCILVGPKEEIKKIAREANINLAPFELIDIADRAACIDESIRLMAEKKSDIIMKGKITTGDLMKKFLEKKYGFRTQRIMSHVALFTVPNERRIMILTDAGVNIAPDLSRKRDIVLNAVDVAHTLGITCPKVAILSFIDKVQSSSAQSVVDAVMLANMNNSGNIPGCIVEGPYALDNAVSAQAAKVKNIKGQVAGCADIIVAHDINMGNAIYKALQVWLNATISAVVVGSKIPVVVPSRVDNKESKLHSIALAVLLAK